MKLAQTAEVPAAATTSANRAAPTKPKRKVVLHLVGSRQDEFYFDLSVLYARACDSCDELDRTRFDFRFAVVHLDGTWSFPSSLEEKEIAKAPSMTLATAMPHIKKVIRPDIMVPHMFCVEGMTRYRTLFDLLEVPYLGNKEQTVWAATDKARTKQVFIANDIPSPRGELCIKGRKERPTEVGFPLIVKPCNEDNSRGITLVWKPEDLDEAMEEGFRYDSRVLVEDYIAGREIRAACIEEADGTVTVLPKIEYFLDDIRTSAHKLQKTESGRLGENAIVAAKRENDRQCPAVLSPALHARIDDAVTRAHRALGCRHYSIFDIRVNAAEQPFLLEAALFCSFSPLSVVPALAEHTDRPELKHPRFFHDLMERTIEEAQGKVILKKSAASDIVAPKKATPVSVGGGLVHATSS